MKERCVGYGRDQLGLGLSSGCFLATWPHEWELGGVEGDQGLCAPALVAHGPDVGGLWTTISCKKSSYIDF